MKRYFAELFTRVWVESEQASIRQITGQPALSLDIKVIIILVYTAIGISVVKYFGNTALFLDVVVHNPTKFDLWYCSFFYGSETGRFHSMLFWVGMIAIFYLIIPALIVKLVFRERLRDYGFRIRNIQKDYPLYLLMLMVMLPLVWFASMSKPFLDRYPLFQPSKENLMPLFFYWQLAYLLQFVAVEFFFRGFMLHGIKGRFGFYAIFIMTIPYCMIHFGKPFAETIAAIPAGIALGALSLKSRSVILGVLIHYSVAICMDLFALWREDYFPF
jgi:hypothetical protein